MQREALRQRIQYLMEHGGVWEGERVCRWTKAGVLLLAVLVVEEGLRLFLMLR